MATLAGRLTLGIDHEILLPRARWAWYENLAVDSQHQDQTSAPSRNVTLSGQRPAEHPATEILAQVPAFMQQIAVVVPG